MGRASRSFYHVTVCEELGGTGIMTDCSKCGDCCRVITLAYNKKELAEFASDDATFILQHWHQISLGEAARRQPMVKKCTMPGYFYECDMFDSETNECTAHRDRPRICRGFPWYGRDPHPSPVSLYPACSFWEDLPVEQHPPHVQMGETRRAG